jgi:hypothetical protein
MGVAAAFALHIYTHLDGQVGRRWGRIWEIVWRNRREALSRRESAVTK